MMTGKIIIQEEISVTKEYIEKVIEHYETLPDTIRMGIGEFYGGKKEIIEEIKELSAVGKKILLMNYRWEIIKNG